MKKSIYKILSIMLILVSTIIFLPSCKDKPEEPEIMPYGVYYFSTYDYDDVDGSPWHNTIIGGKRQELYDKAMSLYGYYFVFTPQKIVFGGRLEEQSNILFTYQKDVDPFDNIYLGTLKFENISFNQEIHQFFPPFLKYYYKKDLKCQKLSLYTKDDSLILNYVYFSDKEVPEYIFSGRPGTIGVTKRDPINYNDYI